MKIVFLDIDGVLQPYNARDRFCHDLNETVAELVMQTGNDIYNQMDIYDVAAVKWDWDEQAVENIRILCEETSAVIVVESDWRRYNDEMQMQALFAIWSLDKFYMANVGAGNKDEAIEAYIVEHENEISSYVIIDDRCVFANSTRQVITCNVFAKEDLQQAINILNS